MSRKIIGSHLAMSIYMYVVISSTDRYYKLIMHIP